MQFNWYVPFLAALLPLVLGFIWYNPKVFGNAWMKAADINEEKMKGAKMGLIFSLTYILSVMAAMSLCSMTIHQMHVLSIFRGVTGADDPNSEIGKMLTDFMAKYGNNFRTFKHGAFHGVLGGFFIALPIIGINALFERKGFKYVAINAGFWIVSLALMGGVICAMV